MHAVIEAGPHKATGLTLTEPRAEKVCVGATLYELALDWVGIEVDVKVAFLKFRLGA